jgi:hypothetical protein
MQSMARFREILISLFIETAPTTLTLQRIARFSSNATSQLFVLVISV